MTTPSTTGVVPTEADSAPGLNREAVVALSESRGEPGWLRESRLAGWAAFEDLPLPRWTKGIAQWWTTDVSELNLSEIRPFVKADRSPEEARAMVALGGEDEAKGGLLVQVNSEVVYTELPESLRERGVVFCSLEEAVRTHPEIVEKYLH